MLSLKTITSVAEALSQKYDSDPKSVTIHNDYGSSISVYVKDKLALHLNRYGFNVRLSIYEKNPNYQPSAGSYRRINAEYMTNDFEVFNPYGPFSSIYRMMRAIHTKETKRIRNETMVDIMTRINNAVDISGIQFEKDVLKGGRK